MSTPKFAQTSAPAFGLVRANFLFITTLLAVFVLASPSAYAAENWPTTRFKIHVGSPYIGDMTDVGQNVHLYEREDFVGISNASRKAFETALQQAAEWYKDKGFPPPRLEPLINTDNGLAYQVYVCNRGMMEQVADDLMPGVGFVPYSRCGYDGNSGTTDVGGYFPLCGSDTSRTKFFQINHDLALDDNGKLNEEGYVTIAHEMFHAIHANSPAGRSSNCKTQKWIGEGLADAIGYDIAEDLWTGQYPVLPGDGYVAKRRGFRVYSEPLYRSDSVNPYSGNGLPIDFGYQASSFWRYIADDYVHGWKVLVTHKKNGPPGLLDIPMSGSASWKDQVDWVDQGLRGKLGVGIQQLYQLFIANISYRVPRFKRYKEKPAKKHLDNWAQLLFGTCKVIDLSNRQIQTVSFDFEPLSSACLRIEPMGKPGMVQVSFIASSGDVSLLKDISIGKSGTTLSTRASPVAETVYGPSPNAATWPTFQQDGSKSAIYLFSNVARKPSETRKRENFRVSAVLPGNTNSARESLPLPPKSAPPPQQPSYKKHAKTLSQQKAATAKMVQQQMNLDKKSLNPNVAAANVVTRVPNGLNCNEPFKYQACGPQTRISLGVMPGTYIIPGQTNTAGGQAGQMMAGLQAMSQTSLFDTQQRMQELTAVIETIDGSDVSIAMPMVDYGYSGTFNRASITVQMAGDRSCSTFGPPDANQMTRLTGKVTIEEYSPAVMIGRFVAPLAEFVEGPNGEGVYRSCGTVTGSFTSAAPFVGDERSRIIQDSHEQMTEDIMNSLGIPADMAYKMKQDGSLTPQAAGGAGSSGSAGGGMLDGDCSCECANRLSADDLCEFFCEEEFAACTD